jgi:hypothetical protein
MYQALLVCVKRWGKQGKSGKSGKRGKYDTVSHLTRETLVNP